MSGAARLFVAIQFSRDVQTAIVDATGDLRSRQPAVRWVRQDQIHLTLRFLGSVSRHRIDGLAEHLWEATEQMGAFDLTLRGLGCFPNVREPAVLWVGIASAAELAETRAAVEDAVAAAGFAREARAFRPHVTIGRVRRGTPFADGFATELDKTRVEVGVRVTSIGLVESTLLPRGAVHREVRGFSLVDDMQIG